MTADKPRDHWTGPVVFVMACTLAVGLLLRSFGSTLNSVEQEWATRSQPELVRKLDETNRQLARIADALEIIAGTAVKEEP